MKHILFVTAAIAVMTPLAAYADVGLLANPVFTDTGIALDASAELATRVQVDVLVHLG
jgi:hypothetical protein